MQTIVAKSAWMSKINWTQGVAALAAALAFFGFDLDAHTQASILAGIVGVQAVVTWFFRTFMNNSVDPSLAGRTVTIQKA